MSREQDYGWLAHIDKRGTPCGWCGEPSTKTIVLEPDEYKSGELHRRGKRIGACAVHARTPEPLPEAVTFRRRRAKDVEQLGLDVGDGQSGNAIYGGDAA